MAVPFDKRFWIKYPHAKEISKCIPLPINDTVTKMNKTKSSKHLYKFWDCFKIKHENQKLEQIDYSKYTLPNKTSEPPNEAIRTIKIRFFPTSQQKIFLKKCFDMHRYFYNKSVAEINARYTKRKKEFDDMKTCLFCNNAKKEKDYTCGNHPDKKLPWDLKINHQSIRESVMKTNKQIENLYPELRWQLDVPYNIRELGSKSACSAYKTAIANRCAGNIKNFSLSFSRKNKPTKYFVLPSAMMNLSDHGVVICPQTLKENKYLKINPRKKKLIKELYKENGGKFNFTTVVCDRKNYFLMITSPVYQDDQNNNTHFGKVISLDPGQVTPLAGFIPNKGMCVNIGENVMKTITRLNEKIDKVRSAFDTIKNKKKKKKYKRKLRGLKTKIRKVEFKIKCIKNNFHIYTGTVLAKGYANIILPEFETSDMQKSDTLASTVKRKLNDIAHYQLKEKIKYFAWKHNSNLQIVTEHYTSKTCPSCGHWNKQEIKNRIFKCSKCNAYGPRDFIGAANILIKTFAENEYKNKK